MCRSVPHTPQAATSTTIQPGFALGSGTSFNSTLPSPGAVFTTANKFVPPLPLRRAPARALTLNPRAATFHEILDFGFVGKAGVARGRHGQSPVSGSVLDRDLQVTLFHQAVD